MAFIISLALITAVTFSLISLVTKLWYVKFKYDSISLSVDSMFLFGLILLPFCIQYYIETGYTLTEFIFGAIGSAISCFANIILFNAISKGLGGPKGALSHLQCVVQTILCFWFLN